MRSMAPFNPYFYTAQPSYQQIPQSMQAYLPMNFPQQNVYSPYLAMQNNQLQNNMYHSYEPQGAMPMKKVKLEPTEPVKATTYIHNQDKKQQHMIMPQNQLYNTAPETSSADTTDSSAGNSPPENITKEVDNFEIGELKMPPVLDQEDLFSDAQNTRATYHEFFSQMEEAMKACWAKQLEFLELLKKLNKPELAMRNPVLDKVNPLIAGVMSKKAKIDENTLTVMKRTHKLLKAGPAVRTTTPKYKIPLEKNLGKRMINSGMVKEEFEAPFTSNFARKTALKAKVKENEETTDQLMAFILQGCNAGNTGNEKL